MIKSFTLFLILFIQTHLLSQHAIEFNYNKIYIGRNINLSYVIQKNKFRFQSGVTFHMNRLPTPLSSYFKNSAVTQNFAQHFGIKIGLDYTIYKNHFSEYGIYIGSQNSSIGQKFRSYGFYAWIVDNPQNEMDAIYTYKEIDYGPVLTSDNVLGCFIKANLTDKLYLTAHFGAGITFWKNLDESMLILTKKTNQGWVVSSQFSLGIGYKFGKKSKKCTLNNNQQSSEFCVVGSWVDSLGEAAGGKL